MVDPNNWKRVTQETVTNLVRLLQVETVHPLGNEARAINIVREILENAGFPQESIEIVESAPNRPNLVARIKGDGSEKPFLLSGHVDVVAAEREKWSRDPFGGEIIDNVVWGRGAIDMKGFLAMYLSIFLELWRQKVPLKRDVILAAISDEETGFTHGSKFLVEQHRDLIDAGYGITEGGAVTTYFGKTRLYPIQVAEKATCRIQMCVRGESGHGAVPNLEYPIFRMSHVIEKLRKAGHLPVHLSPTVLKMLDIIGEQSNSKARLLMRLLHSPLVVTAVINRMKGYNRNILVSWVTNSIVLDKLVSGDIDGTHSSTAKVQILCKLVPQQTAEEVKKEIQRIVGDEAELEIISWRDGTEFSTNTELYQLLVKSTKQMDPGGVVAPMLFPGGTDACMYQQAGITMYGFTPGIMPPGVPVMSLAHGHDERMPVSFIESGLPVLWNVVTEFCGR